MPPPPPPPLPPRPSPLPTRSTAPQERRLVGFLLCQSTSTTIVFLLLRFFIFTPPSFSILLFVFLSLLLSSLLFSLSLHPISHPHPQRYAPLPSLAVALLVALLRLLIGGFEGPCWDPTFRRQAWRTLAVAGFLLSCVVSGFLGMAAMGVAMMGGTNRGWWVVLGVGVRGAFVGLIYGMCYVYWRRWLLKFPVVQRPLFFSFKMGLLSLSLKCSMIFLMTASLCSVILSSFLPNYMKVKTTFLSGFPMEIHFFIGTAVITLCWEVSHNLLQVMYTRRSVFAPPQGSAAAETNPTEHLLECLEQCSPRSLLQYLAYLDLCIVAERNVEPWRRAAFFEETGDTYRRIIAACLRPLEQLTSKIAEGLEVYSDEKAGSSSQLTPDTMLREAFDDFQLCCWSARTAATLTARSHNEDRFGVAQLSGCNASVVTTLLSCLLAVEACMGKKMNVQPGSGSIRWAIPYRRKISSTGAMVPRKIGVVLHAKAYAMADVLRTSLYEIISAFEFDMNANRKTSALERNWIRESSPLYGTKEILVQKLLLFLEFQAC